MPQKTYIGVYAAGFALFLLAAIWLGWWSATGAPANRAAAWRIGFYAFGQFAVVHSIFNVVLLYRMWSRIQDGQTGITTGRAIGFLFVPVFNFYWIFRVWWSYPAEYNRYVGRYDLPIEPLRGIWFHVYPVSILLPFAAPLLFLIVFAKASRAVGELERAVQARRAELAADAGS